jgi:hypothetical protein
LVAAIERECLANLARSEACAIPGEATTSVAAKPICVSFISFLLPINLTFKLNAI